MHFSFIVLVFKKLSLENKLFPKLPKMKFLILFAFFGVVCLFNGEY